MYSKNWRPIILLNTDYKILAKAYANWVKSVLDSIIHKNLTGFLKGRQIIDNVRSIIDTINYVQSKKIAAVLISVDFEKAFDKVQY